jgi:ribosomal protein S18 acetylase RimI-like enzyme
VLYPTELQAHKKLNGSKNNFTTKKREASDHYHCDDRSHMLVASRSRLILHERCGISQAWSQARARRILIFVSRDKPGIIRRSLIDQPSGEKTLGYTIHSATSHDAAAINQLCVEAYEEYAGAIGPANWQQLHVVLSHAADLSSAGELLVAEEDKGLLGVVLYIPPGRSEGDSASLEWASIRMLAVRPAARGRGIGRQLTEACIDRAKRDDAAAIGLTTAEMMRVAQPMYERMGFRKVAELGRRFGVAEARYVLTLKPII